MNKKLLLTNLLIIATWIVAFPQSPDNECFIQPSILDTANSQKILLRVENINFFRNLEYFSPIAEGHTYLGNILRPSFSYQPTTNTSLQFGIHLLKYSGINGFSQTLPFFRFQFRIMPNLDLVMGNLYSTLNHRMIEPMYGFDRYIEENVESGIQFLYHNSHYRGDLWLNWQKFIEFNDPQKEQFSVGYTSEILITNPSKPLKISIPIQFLFAHKGGQNTLDTTSMFTRFNGALGLSLEYHIDHQFIKCIGAYGYYLIYNDLVAPHEIAFASGNGTYANFYLNTSFINFTIGHWTGFQFFNPRGERLFSNISAIDDPERLALPTPDRYKISYRALLLSKVFIHHEINHGINLAAAYESFYDYKNSRNDFYYALYILFNMDFFIYKVK
jgi:hypothetical protein